MLRKSLPAVLVSVLLAGTAVTVEAYADTPRRQQNFTTRDWDNPIDRRGPSFSQEDLVRYQRAQRQRREPPQANANVSGIPERKDHDNYVPDPLVGLHDASLTSDAELEPLPAALLELLREPGDFIIKLRKEHRQPVLDFYAERDFAPLWVGTYGLSIRAQRLLEVMAEADREGLEADHYLPSHLVSFTDDAASIKHDEEALARLDIELTVMALKYAHDASAGRVVPNRLTRFNDIDPKAVDPVSAMAELNRTVRPGRYLDALHPTHPAYLAMKEELAELRADLGDSDETPIASGPTIRPGMTDPRVVEIRRRLEDMNFLDAPAASYRNPVDFVAYGSEDGQAAPGRSPVYDSDVVEAVRDFQEHAGIGVDGIVGSRTLAAFNSRTDSSKIKKLILNMERMRWMPRDFGSRYVLVNQPAFQLHLYENDRTVHTTRVVIGTMRNQTPAFSDTMEIVEFNPYWNVPQSIAVNEMLPQLRRNPYYLARQGFQVLSQEGRLLDSTRVNWWRFGGRKLPVRIRQPPGPSNALGEVKFLFPNRHAVYLHDTPAKKLFDRNVRAYSHGCVRVQNARDFAEVLLRRENWTPERIAAAIANGRNEGMELSHEVKVHLVYMTTWPDADGVMRYHSDIYNRDDRLTRALGTGRLAMR